MASFGCFEKFKVQGSKFKVIGRPVAAIIRLRAFHNLRVRRKPMRDCPEKFKVQGSKFKVFSVGCALRT
jgi:hypothetical protein